MHFQDGQHIHLVGIGGFGISAIARILLERGFRVSGSDLNSNEFTAALAQDGATIYQGHVAENIAGADMLIISSAVPRDHVEVAAAIEQGIPVYKRNEIIADLMEGQTVIAVAGTHGKTTTASMIVHILRECGVAPSYIVGGVLGNTGTNAGIGAGKIFVIEADEYDNMFLGLKPNTVVLTSAEYDHPDFFKSSEELVGSFSKFLALLPDHGSVHVCADDTEALRLVENIATKRNFNEYTYGLNGTLSNHIWFEHLPAWDVFTTEGGGVAFNTRLYGDEDNPELQVKLSVPGKHNILNALAAISVTSAYIQDHNAIVQALATFKSTGRRFDVRGEIDGVIVIDDYAHHPTAINVTLEAAKLRYPHHQIWAVWQPHTFSRTETLLDQFAVAFHYADRVIVTDIYASREQASSDRITGEQASAAIHHPAAIFTGNLDDTTDYLLENIDSAAVIVIMSAGDAPQIGINFLKRRSEYGA